MAKQADRCRHCGREVVAIVRTTGGFSRVCGDCIDRQHALSVAYLPDRVSMDYPTNVPDFKDRVQQMKEGKQQ